MCVYLWHKCLARKYIWHECRSCDTSAEIFVIYVVIQCWKALSPIIGRVQWETLSGSKVGPMANVVAKECETMFLVWSEILR